MFDRVLDTPLYFKPRMTGLSPQSCLYFQAFRGSKLLNGRLVVLQSNYVCDENNNFQDSKLMFKISNFKIPNNAFHAAEFWCIVGLTVIFTFITKEKLHFSLICSFYCYLVKGG